jgi:head-tail adaptor
MRGGQLDRRITIQRPGQVDGDYGPQPTGEWEDWKARLPAQVQDDLPSQSETVQNGLRLADRPARVRIRYLRGITADMRIVVHNEQDDIYQVTSTPAEIGRREWTEFTVKAYTT